MQKKNSNFKCTKCSVNAVAVCVDEKLYFCNKHRKAHSEELDSISHKILPLCDECLNEGGNFYCKECKQSFCDVHRQEHLSNNPVHNLIPTRVSDQLKSTPVLGETDRIILESSTQPSSKTATSTSPKIKTETGNTPNKTTTTTTSSTQAKKTTTSALPKTASKPTGKKGKAPKLEFEPVFNREEQLAIAQQVVKQPTSLKKTLTKPATSLSDVIVGMEENEPEPEKKKKSAPKGNKDSSNKDQKDKGTTNQKKMLFLETGSKKKDQNQVEKKPKRFLPDATENEVTVMR